MKKKLVSALMCAALLASCVAGCGDASGSGDGSTSTDSSSTSDTAEAGDDAAAEEGTEAANPDVTSNTYGDPNGTHLDLWTFVGAHADFYGAMVESWNSQNSDQTIELTATTYPYSDMHNKLLMSFQAGSGAPDICDVEVGQFPNVIAGADQWLVPLNDAAADYLPDMVMSRMETYGDGTGNYYGAPFHVGATVMYWNMAALEAAGITEDDVKAVKTWDQYEELGKKYKEAVPEEGKFFTGVDTGGTDILWLAMAECGDDWTGGIGGTPNVNIDSVKNMLEYEARWKEEGIAEPTPGGQIDTDAGFQTLLDGDIVAFPKAMWYMSRFKNYMADMEGQWLITPCPAFEEGQPRSVGIGGTGTVVTKESENAELAAKFICWAKMSPEGETKIWEDLGFDVCNTSLWDDDAFAHDDSNWYNTFFRCYPYDVLNEISSEIGKISVTNNSPTINDTINITTLNSIFEDGEDVATALESAQSDIELDAE